ncbi:MAG: DMT family permease [Acidobacteria bacterium OLB17]|nr:MAG: DMT family permease [Acidobacteria bacterium OLB17]MCZ2391853.1 DMT family transporter [Acidobacteriota bacterium]
MLDRNSKPNEATPAPADGHVSAFAALVAVQLFYGTLPVAGKVVLTHIPPFALVGFRIGITAAVLAIVQTIRGRVWLADRRDYLRLAGLSVFGVLLNQYLFIGGLALTRASNASILAITIPIFTLLLSALFRYERLYLIKAVGIALAAAGVVFLIDPRKASFDSATTQGDLLMILNSLAFGIYVAISKNIISRNGPFRSMMWVFVFSSIVAIPVGAFSISSVEVSQLSPQIWALILYIGVGATAAPYLLNAYAATRVDPSTVAVFIYLQPVLGVILAVVFLKEEMGLGFILASLLVFAGLFIATRRTAKAAA